MKRLLLDTHTLLWWLANDSRLGPIARDAISDPRNDVFVSAVSSWEISIKKALGKLEAPADMDSIVEDKGFSKLPVTLFHGDQVSNLLAYHKDPFDRMLIVQAQAEGLVIITDDEKIAQYPVAVLAARK